MSEPVVAKPNQGTDASCRAPLFVLFVGAAVWLAIGSLLALIASIKFHGPQLLANVAWLSYGRVHEAALAAQLYGFILPAGFGVALWLFSSLGGNKVVQPWLTAVGGIVWNVGVLVSVLSILDGDASGFPNLQMPKFAAIILGLGFVGIGLWTLLTFNNRGHQFLSSPQWFLLTAFFWFSWIFGTGVLLLLVFPARGVEQAIIDWWYSDNLTYVWTSLVGLATIFYFVPKFSGRPLHSDYLALFTFWTLILFGSWSGVPLNAPVPAWIPTLSSIAAVLTIIPLLTVGVNLRQTLRGNTGFLATGTSARFIGFGVIAWLVAGAMKVANALPSIHEVTKLTWFNVAQSQLNLYGFFAMVMLGVIYYIVPRVTGVEWPSLALVRMHFWFAAAGILLLVVPLAIGGISQGLHWNNPEMPATAVATATLPYLRASTLGDTLILLGQCIFVVNLIRLSVRFSQVNCVPSFKSIVFDLKPAEAKP